MGTGLALDMVDFKERTSVQLREPANKETQMFQLQSYESQGRAGYIRSKCDNNLCLGIVDGSKAEEAALEVQKMIPNYKAQLFHFYGL